MSDEYLGMSDEDFLNADLSTFSEDEDAEVAEDGAAELEDVSPEAAADDADDTEGDDDEEEDDASPSDEGDSPDSDVFGEEAESADGDDAETDETSTEAEADESSDGDEEDQSPVEADQDYETFFNTVTAEFKANGKSMKVDKPEDVVRLMQMGANYNKKMAALKPSMKMLKMLEKHELMSEEKLSYLIDLDQKRPEAIAKLLADSKLDPLDVNLDKAGDYKASDYSVDDRELDLDAVVDEIRDTPTFHKTVNLVSSEWDDTSKQAVANDPQLLRALNDHMASGIYDLVSTEIEQERMLGRLNGLSDIEAYQTVGDAIAARGGFDHLRPAQSQPTKPVTAKPAAKKEDSKRRTKRRAASPSKPAAPSAPKDDFNPLGMSDEEYMKQFDAKFL